LLLKFCVAGRLFFQGFVASIMRFELSNRCDFFAHADQEVLGWFPGDDDAFAIDAYDDLSLRCQRRDSD
jgi:hypothetical protein